MCEVSEGIPAEQHFSLLGFISCKEKKKSELKDVK